MFAAATEPAAENVLDQRQAFGLGIVVEQIEQRGQGQSGGMLGLPVGHRLGSGIHVGNRTFDVGGDDAVADGLQGDLRPFLLQLQSVGEHLTLGQQLVGTQQGQDDEPQRCGEVGHQQQAQDKTRSLPQRVAESLGCRGDGVVDGKDLRLPAADVGF